MLWGVQGCVFRLGGFQRERFNPQFALGGGFPVGEGPGDWYYLLAGSEDRAPQACDPSAESVAIQRERLGQIPGLFPSRWQPASGKRTPGPAN